MNPVDRRPTGYEPSRTLRLDRTNGKVFGVCAGLANYMNVDPIVVRAVFVVGTVFGFGTFLIAYLAIALLAD